MHFVNHSYYIATSGQPVSLRAASVAKDQPQRTPPLPLPVLIVLLIAAIILVPAATGSFLLTVIALAAILVASPIVRTIRKNRYFASEHFQALKSQIASLVAEHNAVVGYVAEIRAQGSFELGSSSTGQHAHLASFQNTSSWNNRRDRNVAVYAPHVHNTSLQVVRNASIDPLKYLMKYFSIKADQGTLADVQRIADSISRLRKLSPTSRCARRTLPE